MTRTSALIFSLLLSVASVACAQGKGPTPPAKAATADSQRVTYDAATKTVTFALVAGAPGSTTGPFNFNGYTSGGAALTVPGRKQRGDQLRQQGRHAPQRRGHLGDGPIPNVGGDPAIPRGLHQQGHPRAWPREATDVMRFTVPEPAARIRIFCGVPGHGLSGMWIWMKVDPAAKAPSFGPTK